MLQAESFLMQSLNFRKLALIFICILVFAQALGAESEVDGFSTKGLDRVEFWLRDLATEKKISGAVFGVMQGGEVIRVSAVGKRDIEKDLPMEVDSLFQIRSMSKPITTVAALQQIEKDRLSLDDKVSRYIPSFNAVTVFKDPDTHDFSQTRPPNRAITVADLMKNTAGLSHRFSQLYRDNDVRLRSDSLATLANKVAKVPLIADPGEQWIYSISMTILGRVIEIVSGAPLDEVLAESIFKPLGMADTGFFANNSDRIARAYRAPGGSSGLQRLPRMRIPIEEKPPLLEGAVGLVSTVPDIMNFFQALLNQGELTGKRILERGSVVEMTRNQIDPHLMPFGINPTSPMLDRGWGYGIGVVTDSSKSAFPVNDGEFAWSGSLGTFAWADPLEKTVFVLMLQQYPSNAFDISNEFRRRLFEARIR